MRVPPFGHARRSSHLRPREVTATAREGACSSPPGPRGGRRPRRLSLDGDRLKQTVRRHLERPEAGTQARVLRGRACASRVARLASACWILGSPPRACVRPRTIAPTPGGRSWGPDGGVVHRSARSRPLPLAEQETPPSCGSLLLVVPSESKGLHDRIRERPTVPVRYGTIVAGSRSRTRSRSAASRFDISCGNRPHQERDLGRLALPPCVAEQRSKGAGPGARGADLLNRPVLREAWRRPPEQ
jgi:hypothetical protein